MSSTRRRGPESPSVGAPSLFGGSLADRAGLVLFILLIALVGLFGGSSWPDNPSLLLLRPASVLLATAMLALTRRPLARSAVTVPGLFLIALALVMAVQLVPLPPAIWTALPGHAFFTQAATVAGLSQPWRPISLSPDLTVNSLVSLVVPGAVLLGAAALRADRRNAAGWLLVGVAVVSGVIGLLQVTTGSLYFYELTNAGRPVGLFANVNHQAALLAATIPIAAALTFSAKGTKGSTRLGMRAVVGAAAAILLLATVLASGSRAGLILAALATLSVPLVIGDRLSPSIRARRYFAAGAVAAVVLLALATWAAGQLGALDRLIGASSDDRTDMLPITLGLLRTYGPWGSGFGTFDAVFQHAEPDAVLRLTYLNHAHNDLLELAITGGWAAVAVAACYLAWLARRAVAVFGSERHDPSAAGARAGVCAALTLMLASLADYPLRTPLAASMLALASLWAADRQARAG